LIVFGIYKDNYELDLEVYQIFVNEEEKQLEVLNGVIPNNSFFLLFKKYE
jgi:hypothetical protein